MNVIFKLSFIFWLIYGTEEQIARCDYKYDYALTYGDKTTIASYYKCDLDTIQSNYDEKLTRIYGQHLTGHNDADVKWIANKDQKLKSISSIFCQKFPNLEVIHIKQAELESIDEDSLLNCKNLILLSLSGNNIRRLPENLLIRNSKLTYFQVDDNQLTTLPENLFLNQKELKYLGLYDNQINFLPSNIFRQLVKLQMLFLRINKLESINPEWLVNLQNLKFLELGENQISEIPSKCFKFLNNLETLWLYGNKITTLNPDSFHSLHYLKELHLFSNEISNLPVGVFTQLKNLQKLSLKSNKLATIHSDSFGVHNKLTWVDLENNKINAIDEKFIDNTAISIIFMKKNICAHFVSRSREDVKNNLRICFSNYQPRSVQIQISSSCGRSLLPQGNIIGGTQIKRGSYPWIAALLDQNGKFFCGGTLVSNRKVVTAAHCIQQKGESQPLMPRSIIVLLGFHDLDNPFETGRAKYAVQGIHIHSDWNPYTTSYDADIAVLMLYREVQFNEYIQPICMTSTDPRIAASTEGTVVGNGKGGQHNEYETIPKILKMPIQTDRVCTDKDFTFQNLLTGRTFCAGSGTGQGICSGDSGSGFVVQTGRTFYLRGIVSASLADTILGCDVNSYSVFTNVLKFTRWINGLSTVPVIGDQIIFPS